MKNGDPICGICDEPLSAHVPTAVGPHTHPREARDEGTYVLVRQGYTMSGCLGGFPGGDDIDMPPVYKFVPKEPVKNARDPSNITCRVCDRIYLGTDGDPCPRCGGFVDVANRIKLHRNGISYQNASLGPTEPDFLSGWSPYPIGAA